MIPIALECIPLLEVSETLQCREMVFRGTPFLAVSVADRSFLREDRSESARAPPLQNTCAGRVLTVPRSLSSTLISIMMTNWTLSSMSTRNRTKVSKVWKMCVPVAMDGILLATTIIPRLINPKNLPNITPIMCMPRPNMLGLFRRPGLSVLVEVPTRTKVVCSPGHGETTVNPNLVHGGLLNYQHLPDILKFHKSSCLRSIRYHHLM
jgi:hypothetical protein